ncbi:helix-turn-helix domain-containing protein [Oceanobacillus oncorhynchi]|uniref:helix-turn-helix domain-containing protein n=1 Tax=Oceanobacillus oncorhynchi TaxID=545501 RepID=UPI0034D646E7
MINFSAENNERGLLPYSVILAANEGEAEAMHIMLQHYESYIGSLSMQKFYDEQGNTYWGIDEDTHDRLRSKLMQSVLAFKI